MFESYAPWVYLLTAVNILLAMWVTVHAVQWKRDSRSVIAWVGLAWLTPMVGALAYLLLGINRIERKAATLHLVRDPPDTRSSARNQDDRDTAAGFARKYPRLIGLNSAGRRLSGLALAPGNSVQPLVDGDQAYPKMLEAIACARRSIGLLSYIFDNDRAGDAFVGALTEASRRGVEVRVLIDDVGAKYSRPTMIRRLRQAGIPVAGFLPTRIPFPRYANMRNHRKILVVDGRTGFTGGTNIREGHWLELKPKHPVQCFHFQLTGPVISQLQNVFVKDWAFATGEQLTGDIWFPAIERTGDVWARGIEHGPDEHFEKMADIMAAGLACARQDVIILTPYFLPNASLIQALNVAALRGVNVQIFTPSASNIALVQWAATAQMWQILEKGCRVWFTRRPFDHTKLMIVDDVWTLLGSTNWDPRSLRLNFEFNVECYDPDLAQSLKQLLRERCQAARPVTLEDVNGRSFPVRLRDGLARLLTPYL